MSHLSKEFIELIEIKNLIMPIFEKAMPLMREYFEKHKEKNTSKYIFDRL